MTTASTERSVILTARLYEIRRTVRSMMGDRFPALASRLRASILTVAEGKNVDPLQAAMLLAKAANGDGHAVAAIMASYVEMIEPSPAEPSAPGEAAA